MDEELPSVMKADYYQTDIVRVKPAPPPPTRSSAVNVEEEIQIEVSPRSARSGDSSSGVWWSLRWIQGEE